jgi:integrase
LRLADEAGGGLDAQEGEFLLEAIGHLLGTVVVAYGQAIIQHGDNKARRDERVPLDPVVVDHLQRIPSFGPAVFPWRRNRRSLWEEFGRIQAAAGIHLSCHEDHEHADACYRYGFHDLGRGFASVNAETMTPDALQALMRHKSYQTTQRYINLAHQVNRAVERLHVPEVVRREAN